MGKFGEKTLCGPQPQCQPAAAPTAQRSEPPSALWRPQQPPPQAGLPKQGWTQPLPSPSEVSMCTIPTAQTSRKLLQGWPEQATCIV